MAAFVAVKNQPAFQPLRQQHNAPDSVINENDLRKLSLKVEPAKPTRRIFLYAQKVRAADKMLLLDNLSTMLAAGLGITDALTILADEIKHRYLKKVILNIKHGIEIGKTLSDGLEFYPQIFPPLLTATIRVGEVSGTLVDVLARLAEMARRENRLKRKVLGALMYPSVVVFAMIVVSVIMLTYVFPQIIAVFKESNIRLPMQIVFINWLGNTLRDYGLYMLVGLFGGIVIIYFLLKMRTIRKSTDRMIVAIPFIGTQIIKGSIITRFASNLRTMLTSGLPIVNGVNIISETMSNLEYRDILRTVAHEIEIGKSIHEALAERPHLFPPIVIQMIKVGEETGKLDDILHKLSIFYEEKVDDILSNLSSVIEPILLLIVGVIVGFIAVSIIGPIYEIANNI